LDECGNRLDECGNRLDLARIRAEQAQAAAELASGAADVRGLRQAVTDWVMEEVLIRADSVFDAETQRRRENQFIN
jgi:hypothetical protein